MILQKIEIEQFGGLKHYELSLLPGAQYLYGENEAGKSTLCAFISAMFYGMPGKVRGAGLKGDMRSLYMPWGESYMAGTLHFQAQGKEYVLKRRFGQTARGDRCTLYLAADWQEVPMDKEDIGPKILGVGEEAFRKTLFISQLGAAFEKGKEDELMTRLSNLEQTGDEDASVQKAISELEKAQYELISKTGRGGMIPQLDTELENLKNELLEAKERNRSFRSLLEEIRHLTREREAAAEALAELDKKRQEAALFEEFEKKQLEQKHLLEQKNRLIKEQEALKKALEELAALQAEKEALAAVLSLETDLVPRLAEKEAAANMLEKQLVQKQNLEQEVKDLEAALYGEKKQDTRRRTVLTAILCFIVLAAAVALGILLSPVFYFLAALPLLLLLDRRGKKEQKDRMAKEARLFEKREALSKLQEENIEENLAELREEISTVFSQAEVASLSALADKMEKGRSLLHKTESREREIAGLEESIKILIEAVSLQPQPEEMEAVLYSGPSLKDLNEKRETLLREQMERERLLAQKNAKAESGFSGVRSVSVIESAIGQKQQRRQELYENYEAFSLAKSVMESCAEELKQSFAPALNEKSGELIARLTDGRYREVKVTDEYKMMLKTDQGGDIIPSDYVSAGTYDLIYFALRLSVLHTLYDKIPLLCMDDTFLQLDKKRRKAAFSVLTEETAEQILYFSCHEPPAEWGEKAIIQIKQ